MVHRLLQATLADEAAAKAKASGELGPEAVAALAAEAERQYRAVGKPHAVAAVAEHCNDRKRAADSASMRSDEVFFCVRLKRMVEAGECDGLRTTGICLGLGGKFMTVFVPDCAKEYQCFYDRMEENYGIKAAFDSAAERTNLRVPIPPAERAETPDAPSFRSFDVAVMSRLNVLVNATEDVPITTDARVLGPLEGGGGGGGGAGWAFTYGASK